METKWCCSKCGALLGVDDGKQVAIRYKEAQYLVGGTDYAVTTVCRQCHTLNSTGSPNEANER